MDAATADLQKVQKRDPSLPHTWFNLGLVYKKENEADQALAQFQQMVKLVPAEPIGHYQLGVVYKLKGDTSAAIAQFETARGLNPRLAAAHFQLFGLYRQIGRADQSAAELRIFQQLKKEQEGAAVPEDVEWCQYAELYDPIDVPAPPLSPPSYREEKLADGFRGPDSGVAVLQGANGRPDLIAWSPTRVALFRNGATLAANSGLEQLRGVRFIAPGDFDNDGLPDLCVLTSQGAVLYRNTGTGFVKHADLATGSFRKAVWIDYDHDYDEDLILVGDDSRLLRNNGEAGFSDETKRFPFVPGRALDAVRFDLLPDTPGFDLVVSYAARPADSTATAWAAPIRPYRSMPSRPTPSVWSPPTSTTMASPTWSSYPPTCSSTAPANSRPRRSPLRAPSPPPSPPLTSPATAASIGPA